MPAAEVDVSVGLVRQLLADQHPDLAHLPLEVLANGWDNLMCRLGDELVVRLPRRAAAAQLMANEQRWLPTLASRLPLPVPAPVRVGRPGPGYPWPWSVVEFVSGQVAALNPPADLHEAAVAVGGFLRALHTPAPPDAPSNPNRGVRLARRTDAFLTRLNHLGDNIDRDAALRTWQTAVAIPEWDGPPLWLHGDLHPANILVERGRVSAIIDFGDLTSGDPSTDLSVAWKLLPPEHHAAFRDAYGGVDDDTWARARGWALALSLVFLAHSADNPLMADIGRLRLDEVLA
jgi:aminoglycoside phosphotransferase (APT) family kinase protein